LNIKSTETEFPSQSINVENSWGHRGRGVKKTNPSAGLICIKLKRGASVWALKMKPYVRHEFSAIRSNL